MAKVSKVSQWRTSRPALHADKCNGCLQCWMFCPDSAIAPEGKAIKFDLTVCKGCGICATECPEQAISMEAEG
jgi:pyruvate ferredoxin oxidoreductase delta subunit